MMRKCVDTSGSGHGLVSNHPPKARDVGSNTLQAAIPASPSPGAADRNCFSAASNGAASAFILRYHSIGVSAITHSPRSSALSLSPLLPLKVAIDHLAPHRKSVG